MGLSQMAFPGAGNRDGDLRSSTLVVRIISLATFLIFFQGFMVAPLLPHLSAYFGVTVQQTSFIEPSYLLGYGAVTLIYAPLSDRYGRLPVILFSLGCFIVLTICTGFSGTVNQMILFRLLTGLGAGGIAPTTISWISDTFSYEKRGHALGIFFGSMAGGTALGSFAGALLEPLIGWSWLFFSVAAVGALIFVLLLQYRESFSSVPAAGALSSGEIWPAIREILGQRRAVGTYSYVLINAMFHSGVFTWLGYLLFRNYHLGETGIGLSLLGYGIPGFVLGPFIGRMADKYGRNKIIPVGLAVGGVSAICLGCRLPLAASNIVVALLSLGFDMTHPLFAAIATTLSSRKGLATGLFAFFLFIGYGFGSLLFSLLVPYGLENTFILFGSAALVAALMATMVFRSTR
ncbi:MFS transporter [Chitinophaga sp. 212800010-3]|uniref:MFS transporter n=1 Tax=unclassified Chitinophaga TaxID=2619133 RepID=UPI002E139CC5